MSENEMYVKSVKIIGVEHAQNMREPFKNSGSSEGFTLFEMVAFIIVAAIIYSVAVNRFSDFPEAAERANFLAVLTQIQTGINLEIMLGFSTGIVSDIQQYEDLNPMDLLLKAPSNYLGEIGSGSASELPRRSWYFDDTNNELVYLINEPANAYLLVDSQPVPTTEFRFKIIVMYRDPESLKNLTGDELAAKISEQNPELPEASLESIIAKTRMSGAVLRPVIPYRWEEVAIASDELLGTG